MWDQRFAEEGFAYGESPNAFFKEALGKLYPGKLLLPAEGDGRHALHAAALGWTVDALDFSEVAQKKTLARAATLGLSLRYDVMDLADYVPVQGGVYDAVGLVYVHLPPALRKAFHQRIVTALKPGGRVILFAYHARQLSRGTGGPAQPELLFTADQLRGDFLGLEMEILDERVETLDEGKYHQGVSELVRMVGRKP
jgi:SAM-dependent methyltransferase